MLLTKFKIHMHFSEKRAYFMNYELVLKFFDYLMFVCFYLMWLACVMIMSLYANGGKMEDIHRPLVWCDQTPIDTYQLLNNYFDDG